MVNHFQDTVQEVVTPQIFDEYIMTTLKYTMKEIETEEYRNRLT